MTARRILLMLGLGWIAVALGLGVWFASHVVPWEHR